MFLRVGLLAGCFRTEVGDVVDTCFGEAEVVGAYETTTGPALLLISSYTGEEWLHAEASTVLVAKRLDSLDGDETPLQIRALDRAATPPPRDIAALHAAQLAGWDEEDLVSRKRTAETVDEYRIRRSELQTEVLS